jgi:hypothetical protein
MTPEEIAKQIVQPMDFYDFSIADRIAAAIENAIREERERCARIADLWAANVVHPEISKGIAAAIRSTDTETGT